MNRHKGTSDWLAVVNLPTLALCALVIAPDVGWSASNFPACPAWTHNLMFVNAGNSTVHVKETPGCFANSIGQPPFSGTRCWPLQAGGGFDLKPGAANAVTVKMTSCWSGNFGIACASCKSGVQTLAEFTFDGGLDATAKKLPGLLDTYDVSLVDGFTKALSIAPDNNVKAGGGTCSSAGCKTPSVCPGKLVDGDACLSPNQYVAAHASDFSDTDRKKYGCVCSVTESGACSDNANHDVPAVCVGQFGCSPFSQPGQSNLGSACCPFFNDPSQRCSATTKDRAWDQWAVDYIQTVHKNCPGEYAWQYDDEHGTFTCEGNSQTPMNYTVTVSPSQK
jgi:Thaumatin family